MADFDITLAPVKRASFDVGRKMKFWTAADGVTPVTVKNHAGATLTQPIRVPASGHLEVRFDQWPVWYSDNRGWTRIKKVPGMPATIYGNAGTAGLFDVVATVAEINAGTKVIVPAQTGKQFIPLNFWAFSAGSNMAGATLIRLIHETTSNVVMSHAIADFNSNAVVYKTGGTVVITELEKMMPSNKAILCDKTGSTLTGVTSVCFIVQGIYV